MKTHKFRLVYICALAGINLLFSILYILHLPESVPVHFSTNWVCDRMGSRWNGLLFPLIPVTAILPIVLASRFDKKNENVTSIISMLLALYFVVLDWLLLFSMGSGVKVGEKLDISYLWILMLMLSVSFVGIGNFLPVVGKNKLLGVRTKYTMENEACWKLTHRFTGRLWVITGLLWTGVNVWGILSNADSLTAFCVLIAVATVDILLPVFYSYEKRNA